jgi:tetratricopeptide (TPR) repeat protein
MLRHLGRFAEAEASLREAVPLQEERRLKALALNSLGLVLMDKEQYPEAIATFEKAIQAWRDRGSSHRAIAEACLRQGRELPKALECARRALEMDRAARGLDPKVLNCRISEDLATLAWAVAVNSADLRETDPLLAEAFPLCAEQAKAIQAQVHYHAGCA